LLVEPETRYVRGSEGQLAYQVVGDGPVDLIYLTAAASHVDARWEIPQFARFNERLSAFSRLIMFDRLGNGASDRTVAEKVQSLQGWAEDLRLVLDTVGSEQTAVVAVADAGFVAQLFAATYPERVSALVLANTTARWLAAPDYPHGATREAVERLLELIEEHWGSEEFTNLICPSLAEDPTVRRLYARQLRASATPHVSAAQLRALVELDLRRLLPQIRVPTLVLHRRDFALAPIEHGRYLARHIPGARLVELDGGDSALPFGDADVVLEALEEFLTGGRHSPDPDRMLAIVMFTDLVQSTARAAEIGDRKWAQLLSRHDQLIRQQVERFHGRVWKSTGDGVLATFAMPRDAIRAAASIRGAMAELGLNIRIGLHAGEIAISDRDIEGLAVHIAARVTEIAAPGEVLLSRTVCDLLAGSGIAFVARGIHSLKGVPGQWPVYTVDG
jgi:class 3 adenylate cyclase